MRKCAKKKQKKNGKKKGIIFAIVPIILAKLCAGLAAWPHALKVGFAMVSRGEFSYVVAQIAIQNHMISEQLYAIVVWALLWSVIVAPIIFGRILKTEQKKVIKSGVKCFKIIVMSHIFSCFVFFAFFLCELCMYVCVCVCV